MLARKPGDKCVYKNVEVTIHKTVKDHSNGNEYYELSDGQKVTESDLQDLFIEVKKAPKK